LVLNPLSCARSYVSVIERGQRNPTVIVLWQLAKALDIKPVQFLDENTVKRWLNPSGYERKRIAIEPLTGATFAPAFPARHGIGILQKNT